MITPINMPKYGLQQDEGTIIEWKKEEGDRIEKGDILLELETDKAVFEYEAPTSGYLRHILAQNGAVVPVLSPIAVMADELDEPVDLDAFTKSEITETTDTTDSSTEESVPDTPDTSQTSTHSTRIKRSPAARHRARELDIDLATITGTGPGTSLQLQCMGHLRHVLHLFQGPVEPRLEGIGGNAGTIGDLLEGHFLKVLHFHHLTLFKRQLLQQVQDDLIHFTVCGFAKGIPTPVTDRIAVKFLGRPAPAIEIGGAMGRDAEQPGGKGRFLGEAIQIAVYGHKDLLHQIHGVFPVAGHAQGVVVDPGFVAFDELFPGPLFALQRLANQLDVRRGSEHHPSRYPGLPVGSVLMSCRVCK